jgi:NADPH:quinone reductase-like Zn-dependent oxidoreductase
LAQLFPKPERLSFEQAAAIPVNYVTAYALIVVMGSLQRGETVLIQNAGGGVGLAALSIAKHIGARTIGTASPSKHQFLQQMGLDHAVDYRRRDWPLEVLRLTDGKGVELVLDPIGPNSWRQSYRLLRHTGRLGMYGFSEVSGSRVKGILLYLWSLLRVQRFRPFSLMGRTRGVYGFNLGHVIHEKEKIRTWMTAILEGVGDGWINPYVAKIFHFDQIAEAHAYIESRSNMGKVVLIP